jgi:type I restriction enzyme R subunit
MSPFEYIRKERLLQSAYALRKGKPKVLDVALDFVFDSIAILGETAKKAFIALFGAILRLRNILTAFDDFAGNEILSEREFQDYQSLYIDLYQEFRPKDDGDKENINDDIIFEIELIKQIEVNIDYILMLVAIYHESNCTDKEILTAIDKAVNSSIELRSKKELIEASLTSIWDWYKYKLFPQKNRHNCVDYSGL